MLYDKLNELRAIIDLLYFIYYLFTASVPHAASLSVCFLRRCENTTTL